MRQSIGILCAAALSFLAVGVFSISTFAQTAPHVPGDASAPTIAPAPPEASEMTSPASSSLVPLSDLSDKNAAAPAKRTKAKHTHRRKSRHKKKTSNGGGSFGSQGRIRAAQIDLVELGYQAGSSDGVMGTKTKAALKEFQRDHHLQADGILGPVTYDALVRETGSKNPERSSSAPPPENFYATHPDYYGYFGPDYANPSSFGSQQTIPSRFGTLQLNAQQTGQTYHFDITLNGAPVFHADNQPNALNVSRTFNLDNADAVVLTAFAPGDSVCPYRHDLLVLRANTSELKPIAECTRDYQAYTENGMLTISFPGDHVSGWSSGAVWRYDNGALTKL